MEREGYIFYASWWEGISELSNDKIKLEVLTAIMEYGLYGKQPENLGDTSRAMFRMAKAGIDSNNKRYQDGKKGGRPKKDKGSDGLGNDNDDDEKKPVVSDDKTSGFESENPLFIIKDKDKDKDKDNLSLRDDGGTSSAEREIFIAKKILFFEKGIIQPQKEAERFFNHYKKTGWNDANGNEVRNKWAALRNWDAKAKESLPDGQGETWSVFCNIASDTNFERMFIDGIYGMRFKDGELEIKCRKKTMQAIEDKMEQNKERVAKWKQAYLPTTDITYTLL